MLPKRLEPYGAVLDAMLPGCEPEQRRQRAGILYLRDRATRLRGNASTAAERVLQAIEAIGLDKGFASMTDDQLKRLHYSMVMLTSVATDLEGIEG